jgi:hypothetical protein
MKSIQLILCLFSSFFCVAQTGNYQTLDPRQPIAFYGDHILFDGKKIILGPKAFFY